MQKRKKRKPLQSEVGFDLCQNHKDIFAYEIHYPDYIFNDYIQFPSRPCQIVDCTEEAFHTVIGLRVPNTVGNIERQKYSRDDASGNEEGTKRYCRGVYELYFEAKALMENAPALDGLTGYLRTRIIPSKYKEMNAEKHLQHYASLVLKEIHIKQDTRLEPEHIQRILLELEIYPETMKDA